jgi:cytochrome c oxidase subunit 1
MMGGFSGVMHSAAPADSQQHNSYFVVAHFHYVLIGGSTFALLAAIHYWFPKFFGRTINEFWGKVSFWVIFVGFNTTFFPMHFLGLNGMPRRTWTYDANMGWNEGNFISSLGAYLLGLGILIYLAAAVWSYFRGEKAGPDPWDARTLEWSIPSPPPEYNFAVIPTVHARDAWWYEKSHPAEIAREKSAHARDEAAHGGIHLPDQSWYPLVAAAGLLTAGLCFAHDNFVGAIAGGAILFAGIYLWSLEGPGGYHVHPETPADAASH